MPIAASYAVEPCEFALKVMEGAQAGIFFLNVIERAGEEVVDLGFGAFGLGNFFDHRTKIRCDEGVRVVESQLRSVGLHGTLAQGVELARFAGGPGYFCGEKKIDLAGEAAVAAARAFGNGIDEAMLKCAPADDRAGVGQFRHTEDDAR